MMFYNAKQSNISPQLSYPAGFLMQIYSGCPGEYSFFKSAYPKFNRDVS